MAHKYAGVTLDWFDDRGATLKEKFPTPESLPDIIKEADIRETGPYDPADWGIIFLDEGHVFHKYACNDAGTSAMSAIYFMEHGDKLPDEARKLAAANISIACLRHGVEPPEQMWKIAGVKDRVGQFFTDIASKALRGAPTSKVPVAKGGVLGGVEQAIERGGEKVLKKAPEVAEQVLSKVPAAAGKAGQKAGEGAVSGALQRLGEAAQTGARRAAVAGGIGAGTSAGAEAMAGERDPRELLQAALRGGAGGLAGGALGAGLGGLRGGALGAALGGGLAAATRDRDEGGMTVTASQRDNVVDITGKLPATKVKVAEPQSDDDYAVIMADGSRHYPINSWDLVKQAESYFQENRKVMQADIRRQFAVKLASKAQLMGYPLDEDIRDLGATTYAGPGHLKAAIEMRKMACDSSTNGKEWLDDLFDKHASVHPDVYAECLRRFDIDQGFDRGWGHLVPDPWESTFAKKEASVVWEHGAERVTDDELINLARNGFGMVKKQFTEDFTDAFQKDPIALFNSMPTPQKKLLARMANDASRDGRSEFAATKSEAQGGGGHGKTL